MVQIMAFCVRPFVATPTGQGKMCIGWTILSQCIVHTYYRYADPALERSCIFVVLSVKEKSMPASHTVQFDLVPITVIHAATVHSVL